MRPDADDNRLWTSLIMLLRQVHRTDYKSLPDFLMKIGGLLCVLIPLIALVIFGIVFLSSTKHSIMSLLML